MRRSSRNPACSGATSTRTDRHESIARRTPLRLARAGDRSNADAGTRRPSTSTPCQARRHQEASAPTRVTSSARAGSGSCAGSSVVFMGLAGLHPLPGLQPRGGRVENRVSSRASPPPGFCSDEGMEGSVRQRPAADQDETWPKLAARPSLPTRREPRPRVAAASGADCPLLTRAGCESPSGLGAIGSPSSAPTPRACTRSCSRSARAGPSPPRARDRSSPNRCTAILPGAVLFTVYPEEAGSSLLAALRVIRRLGL